MSATRVSSPPPSTRWRPQRAPVLEAQQRRAVVVAHEGPHLVALARDVCCVERRSRRHGHRVVEGEGDGRRADVRRGLQLEVQVRRRRAPGVAAEAERLARGDGLALAHGDAPGGEVGDARVHAGRVVDDHHVAPVVLEVAVADGVVGHAVDHARDDARGGGHHREAVAVEVVEGGAVGAEGAALVVEHLEVERVAPRALVGDAAGRRPASRSSGRGRGRRGARRARRRSARCGSGSRRGSARGCRA